MAKIKITQIRSLNSKPKRQKATMQALGLQGINKTVEHDPTPQILGMIGKVKHLVKIESK